MVLTDGQLTKIAKISLISIYFILLVFFASPLVVFNIYAQGGTGTGGTGQINQGTCMTMYCAVNNAYVITGSSATGGSGTGGNANNDPSRNLLNISSIQTNNTSTHNLL
jgi:hypothetical protein